MVCLSIFPRGNGVNDKNSQGWSQADANASIKYIAQQFGQYYIDCTPVAWSSDWGASTFDKLHPTAYGGTQLATHIYNRLISQRIITRALKRTNEVEEAERLLDLSFTADGIVNQGTYESKVGKRGTVSTFYDAARDTYYGCTKARESDYFFATYDAGSSLAEAFNNNVTWEMLVRLDSQADQSNNISRTCILGNEESGGWVFYNSPLASCFSYQNKSGVKSTMKSITGDSILVSGKFYHLVVTMDRTSHIMRYFINGKLVCTGTRAGTDMTLPQCGSVSGRKGMWICLGGDAASGSYYSGAENSSACTFVFVRIYNGALSQAAATNLYNDDVKKFTEPQPSHGKELLMDCEFTPDSAVNNAPSYLDKPIVMNGEVPMNYNADINLYEAQFNKTKSQFFKYFLGDDPSIMNQLSDSYSVEVFCRSSSALPSANIRPLSFLNGYGFGLQMSSKGNIGYATTTLGNKADGTYAKTQWIWAGEGILTDAYMHYVIVYDRKNYTSKLYINGELVNTRWLTFKECPVYEWTPSTWLAIGGDAKGNYDAATSVGSYPFMGEVAMVRVYGRALKQSEVQNLKDILLTQEKSYTFGSNGYVAVCLPYVYQVPEGCTAYIVSEVAYPSVMLKPIARAGEYVPYGTPVFMKGTAKATITLTALNKNEVDEKYLLPLSENLLIGTFPGKTLAANEGYYLRTTTDAYIYRASTSVNLPAFSCYLPLVEKKVSYKLVEEESTGIVEVKTSDTKSHSPAIYDLSGKQVHKAKKGIYIQGNKKILVK